MDETRVVLRDGGGESPPDEVLDAIAREYANVLGPEDLADLPPELLADDEFWDWVQSEWGHEPDPPESLLMADDGPLLSDLSPDGLLDELQAAWRRQARTQARQAMLITELAMRRSVNAVTELTGRHAKGKEAVSIASRTVIEEVRLELNLTRPAAANLVDTALGLRVENPDTLDLLARGEITWDKAAAIAQLVQTLVMSQRDANGDLPAGEQVDPEHLGRDLEKDLLKKASELTLPALKQAGEKAQITANPKAVEFRHRKKRERRYFSYTPDEDSMGRISAYLPADQGIMAKNALTRLAHHAQGLGDTRTLDQLRVDTLVTTLTTAADQLHPQNLHPQPAAPAGKATPAATPDSSPAEDVIPTDDAGGPGEDDAAWAGDDDSENVETAETPTSTGGPAPKNRNRGRSGDRNPRVTLVMGIGTMVGDDDQPAHLQGHGPIIASMARKVAATGTWQCAITDDVHGTLLGLGTSTYTPNYRPSQALRNHLMVRDQTCRVPGCNQPAVTCDIDHRLPWPEGDTCECDTECLCGEHHRIKDETGFTLTPSTNPHDPPGTLIWGTPGGRKYPSYPAVLNDPKPFGNGPGDSRLRQDGDGGDEGDCGACTDAEATIADDARWENPAQNGPPTSSSIDHVGTGADDGTGSDDGTRPDDGTGSDDGTRPDDGTRTGFVNPLPPSSGPVPICLGTTSSNLKPYDHYAHAVRLGWPRRPVQYTGPDRSGLPLYDDGPPPF